VLIGSVLTRALADVIEQLRALVVDELEEEGSEWDASCVSSEQMDGIAEMSMQVMRDGDDPDMTRLS
jgi:ubiquitin carboxyl-terminal hydrolase 34